MSAKSMGKVWDISLAPAQQLVLLALADHADHNDSSIFPSAALVAWKTGYSERQVRRIMNELVSVGLLVKVQERRGKPTVYRIDFSKGAVKPAFVLAKKPTRTPDKMSPRTPDIAMSYDKMSPLTSSGKQLTSTPDMASLKNEDEPSIYNRHQYVSDVADGYSSPVESKDENAPRPLIYTLYEQAFGRMVENAMLAQELTEMAKEYPQTWLVEAFTETGKAQARSIRYTRTILEKWRLSGKPVQAPQPAPRPPAVKVSQAFLDSLLPDSADHAMSEVNHEQD